MPVYNRETLVSSAIRSIQNQTFKDWELIVLDDGSTDKTPEVCRTFEAEDKRIHVHANQQNLGVGQSRNRLLTFATGKYIAIQDSDDVSLPERLAREIEIFETKPDIGVVSGVTAWTDFDNGRELWYYPVALHRGEQFPQDKERLVRLLYKGCEVANAACMFRRSLVENLPSPYGRYRFVDDWNFLLHLSHRTLFWGVPDVLVKMARGKNHSHLWADFSKASKEARQLCRDIYNHYKDDPLSPINRKLYRKSISTLLTSEGRYTGGWSGLLLLLQAILWDPHNKRAREFIREGYNAPTTKSDDYSKWLQA